MGRGINFRYVGIALNTWKNQEKKKQLIRGVMNESVDAQHQLRYTARKSVAKTTQLSVVFRSYFKNLNLIKPKIKQGGALNKVYIDNLWEKAMRYSLEKFFFKKTGIRTYVFLNSILGLTLYRFSFWLPLERKLVYQLSRKSGRFAISEVFALLLVRSIGFMFTSVGGLVFFGRLLTRLFRRFRHHWALMRYIHTFMGIIRMSIWYQYHIQYRLTVRGRFGGVMRAAKKLITHGVLKLYLWTGVLDYMLFDIATRWGVFGVGLWVQFRDMPQLRVGRFILRYKKILRALAVGADLQQNKQFKAKIASSANFSYENASKYIQTTIRQKKNK